MYHKDITEYFCLPQGASVAQQNIQNAYSTHMYSVNGTLVSGPEKSVALRKLLESFDAAMRAAA